MTMMDYNLNFLNQSFCETQFTWTCEFMEIPCHGVWQSKQSPNEGLDFEAKPNFLTFDKEFINLSSDFIWFKEDLKLPENKAQLNLFQEVLYWMATSAFGIFTEFHMYYEIYNEITRLILNLIGLSLLTSSFKEKIYLLTASCSLFACGWVDRMQKPAASWGNKLFFTCSSEQCNGSVFCRNYGSYDAIICVYYAEKCM